MVKKSSLGSRRRPPKQSKTIDLKANETAEAKEKAAAVKNVTDSAKPSEVNAKQSSGPAAGKPKEGSSGKPSNHDQNKISSKQKTKLVPMLISGLVGGGVALGGMGLLNQTGLMGAGGGQADNQLNQEIAALQNELVTLKNQLADQSNQDGKAERALPALLKRVGVVEAKQAEASSGSTDEGQASSDALANAIKIAEDAKRAADQANTELAGLKDKIVANSGAVDTDTLKGALGDELTALASRVEKIETAKPSAQMPSELADKLYELETAGGNRAEQLNGMEDVVGQLKAGNEGIASKLAALDKQVSDLSSTINDTVIPNMSNVEKAAGAALEGQNLARSISARALNGVLEEGGQFSNELLSAKALLEDSKSVRSLKMYASTGIKSKTQLIEEFGPIATKILSTPEEVSEEAGFLGKLVANAKTLVSVRPAGPIEGDSDTAILSRIDAALKNDDFKTASSEWNGLSSSAKALSKRWAMALKDRLKVEDLIGVVVEELSKNPDEQG